MYKSIHFKIYELVDPHTYGLYGEKAWMFFDEETIMMIDGVREFFTELAGRDCPMTINDWYWGGEYEWSGLRTIECKEGADRSFHRLAKGFDLKNDMYEYEHMRIVILANQDNELLQYVKRIEADTPTWLHVDRANVGKRIVVVHP